jgi:hypothetical protein
MTVIPARECINLTQGGLNSVGFMQTPTPRGRGTEYGLCTLVKSFTNPHPMEASSRPAWP